MHTHANKPETLVGASGVSGKGEQRHLQACYDVFWRCATKGQQAGGSLLAGKCSGSTLFEIGLQNPVANQFPTLEKNRSRKIGSQNLVFAILVFCFVAVSFLVCFSVVPSTSNAG